MCGHLGIMGKQLLAKHEDAVEDGLFVSALRGTDSVGVGVVPYDGKKPPFVQKRLGMAPFYFRIPVTGAKAIIGHVRSATIGGRDDRELAHPFMFDNIIGAHNGTLRGNWRTVLQDQTNEIFGSDSQAIFYNFAYWGVKETIESIYGAWCLVWWDEDECTLNMLRNDERPMWTARGKDGNLYWASEHWMINAMLRAGEKDRDKLVRTKVEGDGDEERFFHKLPKNVWRRWSFDEQGEVVQLADTPLEGKPEPAPAPQQYRTPYIHVKDGHKPGDSFVYAKYENGNWVEGSGAEDKSLKLSKEYFEGAPNTKGLFYRVVSGVPYVSRPGSEEITFSEFLDFRSTGCCSTCGTNIGHPAQIGYLPKDLTWFLCKDCTNDWVSASDTKNLSELLKLMDEDVEETGKPEGMFDPTEDRRPGMVTMGTNPDDVWKDYDSGWVVTTASGNLLLGTGCKTRQECMAYVAKMKGSNLRAMHRSSLPDADLAVELVRDLPAPFDVDTPEMDAKIEAAMQADAEAAYAASVDPDRQRRRLRREKANASSRPLILDTGPPLHPLEQNERDFPLPFEDDLDDALPVDLEEMLPPALLAKVKAHAEPKRDMSKWNWFDGPRGK